MPNNIRKTYVFHVKPTMKHVFGSLDDIFVTPNDVHVINVHTQQNIPARSTFEANAFITFIDAESV